MKEKTARSIPIFLIRVMIIHTLTYFIAGMLASSIFDYRSVFNLPIIRDYMIEFGTASIFWGPFIQPIRGLIIGLVLIPFRRFLADSKYGWLYLWLIFVGIGIVSTPAAAPSSIEGIIYTKLPLWYHLFGLPEILAQTLVFSALVYLYMRHPAGILNALPPVFSVILQSFAGACFAFIGYAVISIIFAIAGNAEINSESNMSLKVQGLFVAPFVCNFAITAFLNLSKHVRKIKRIVIFQIAWLSNAIVVMAYQQIFLGGADIVYAIIAPVLPAVITAIISSKKTEEINI
jgi:hypothetical protein